MAWNDSGWFPTTQLKLLTLSNALDKINQMFIYLNNKFNNILFFQLDGGNSQSDWDTGSLVDGGGASDYA